MSGVSRMHALLQPFEMGGIVLPNRIIMSPMTRGASPGGVPTAAVAAYYARRAAGGVGTIFTESVFVNDEGTLGKFSLEGSGENKPEGWPVMFGDAPMEGWRAVVEAVHAAGGKIFPQLMHLGPHRTPAKGQAWTDIKISSPSGIWGTDAQLALLPEEAQAVLNNPEKAMTEAEILSVINAFAEAAANAKSVGFDGIALHGGHGYLIDSFTRPETNRRTDSWGGDLAGRLRFPVELVRAVRAAIGPDMPISYRLSQWVHHDLDQQLAKNPEELQQIITTLDAAGVDIFEASARAFPDLAFEGSPLNLSSWIKRFTAKPVVMLGGTGVQRGKYDSALKPPEVIDNVDEVMQRFAEGQFDLLAIGRSLLNDPNWVRKADKGETFVEFNPACLKIGYVE